MSDRYDNAEVWRILLELDAMQMLPKSDHKEKRRWVFENVQNVIELELFYSQS